MESAYEDSSKRGKLLGLAMLITLVVFIVKIFQTGTFALYEMYLIAFGCAFVTYLVLLWTLGKDVSKKSVLLYIPQSALLVFSEVLFIELFFFSKFDRVYEAILLLVILGILFISSYASFLMVNIFSVSSFKVIPLEQVAKTVSYITSLLVTYFLMFAVLSSEFVLPITIVLVILVSLVVSVSHIAHLRLSRRMFRIGVFSAVLNVTICAVAAMLLGVRYEIIAVAPTVAMFVSVALIVNTEMNKVRWFAILEYILLIFAAFAMNFVI